MERADIAVIGAGVVGLAVAERLSRAGRSVVVLESHERYGVETSSRNSEVIHAGIHYPAGSLKSRLCHQGRRMIYEFAEKAGLFVRKTGKLVVAVDADEAASLDDLFKNAQESGAEGLAILEGPDVQKRIPWIKAQAALWSPESGIIDSEDLMRYFHDKACDQDAVFVFGVRVTGLELKPDGYVVTFGSGKEQLQVRSVVNAAGLHSDRVAAMAGIDIDAAGYRLHWCKGSYFRHKKKVDLPHLVYPMPGVSGLGVHLTPDKTGRVRLGPDAVFVDSQDYAVDPVRGTDFHAAVSKYWPDLKAGHIFPDTSGIRPKLSGPGGGFKDFVIAEESSRGRPGLIDLIGIESPGLTASPAIAEMVAGLIP